MTKVQEQINLLTSRGMVIDMNIDKVKEVVLHNLAKHY